MKILNRLRTLVLMTVSFLPALVHAEIAIVVHPDSTLTAATKADVVHLFLGKRNAINGVTLKAIDQEEGSATRDEFYTKVVGKSAAELNSYWAKRIFSGKGAALQKVLNDVEVVDWVADEDGWVGYINPSAVDSSVKVILVIP